LTLIDQNSLTPNVGSNTEREGMSGNQGSGRDEYIRRSFLNGLFFPIGFSLENQMSIIFFEENIEIIKMKDPWIHIN
jgi:hypothetical protein